MEHTSFFPVKERNIAMEVYYLEYWFPTGIMDTAPTTILYLLRILSESDFYYEGAPASYLYHRVEIPRDFPTFADLEHYVAQINKEHHIK